MGGKLDLAAQRFVDAWMAFPGLLLLLTIMSLVGQGLLQIIVVLGMSGGNVGSRVVRGAVVGIKENDYFLAARAVGTPTSLILIRYVLPNIMAPLIIVFSINIGGVIIAEASLSFLGFGLPPEIPSWGSMLSGEGHSEKLAHPFSILYCAETHPVYAGRALIGKALPVNSVVCSGDSSFPPSDHRVGAFGLSFEATSRFIFVTARCFA